MLIINCPNCGPRPELEFRYGGEAHVPRPAATDGLDDDVVADRLYMRSNPKGIHLERWRHAHGCGKFFNAVRDTVSDFFLATYRIGEPRPDIEALKRGAGR
jgi:sarcosine oxidase, subunit delta